LVIVADSSYITEGLLSNKELLKEQIISPELIIYETANTIWKHEYLLKRIQNGQEYLSLLYGLINSGKITVIFPDENLIQDA
jgi:predicted nucleic acid-binding protein